MQGPFVTTNQLVWSPSSTRKCFYKTQSKYKTDPGTRRTDLPYSTAYYSASDVVPNENSTVDVLSHSSDWPFKFVQNGKPSLDNMALTRCRSRFLEAARGSQEAQLGAAIGEGGEAILGLTRRLKSLFRAARALKKGDLKVFVDELAFAPENRKRTKRWVQSERDKALSFGAELSSVWLEFSFGWAPLVDDVLTSCDILSNLGGNEALSRVRGRGHAKEFYYLDNKQGTDLQQFVKGWKVSRAQFISRIRLTNPNLALAESLGLVNPAAIAWELVPFSFVIDRFVNVGDFLSSFTTEFGWEVESGTLSRTWTAPDFWESLSQRVGPNFPWKVRIQAGSAKRCIRTINQPLPKYTLQPPTLKGLSLLEAGNYAALLVGALQSLVSTRRTRR